MKRCRDQTIHVILFLLSLLPISHGRRGLPRSSSTLTRSPPWNPSLSIDDNGFLTRLYARKQGDWEEEFRLRTSYSTDLPCQVRQVPGDGNCLFHSLSLCLLHAHNGTHWDMNRRLDELYDHSRKLRAQAVECLRQERRRLVLQGKESLRARELVKMAASQYDMSPEDYCDSMEQDCVWGGGPELVALANVYKRPIHVYELAVKHKASKNRKRPAFVLRRMACFGSPKYDRKEAIHILSADSRFPDLQPGQQLSSGNHFLALFPYQKRRRSRLRGGDIQPPEELDLGESDDETDQSTSERRSNRLVRCWEYLTSRLCYPGLSY